MSTIHRIPEQEEISVYVNDDGAIAMESFNPLENERALIVIHPDYVDALLRALRAAKREANGTQEDRNHA